MRRDDIPPQPDENFFPSFREGPKWQMTKVKQPPIDHTSTSTKVTNFDTGKDGSE